MGPRHDLDDLLDAEQVANLLGLSSTGAVSVYKRRYSDFPEPAIVRGSGRCQLWVRQEIDAWKASRPQE